MVQANHLPPADRKVPSDFTTIPFPSRRRRTEKKPSLSAEPLKTDGTRQDSEGHSTGVVHSQSDTPPQAQVALPKQISAEISPNSSASGMYNPGNSLKKRKFDSLDNEERLGDDRALKERIYRQKAGGDRASKRRYFPVPRLPVLPRLFEAWRL